MKNHPSFWKGWLSVLAPLYFLSPLSVLALGKVTLIPKPGQFLLIFYVLSQLIPALFSQSPLSSLILGFGKALFVVSLITVGAHFKLSERLRPVVIGVIVVYCTAFIYSYFISTDVFRSRLEHPYMTATTLGLIGALGTWISLFNSTSKLWKHALGITGVIVVFMSGSRGALLSLLFGCLCGLVIKKNKYKIYILILIAVSIVGVILAGSYWEIYSLERLLGLETTGRDIIWNNVVSVIKIDPLVGIGNYKLGTFLLPLDNVCSFWQLPFLQNQECPTWVTHVGPFWLIAHNAILQTFAESGPLGAVATLSLVGCALAVAVRKNDTFSVVVITGMTVANILDNTLNIPGPFIGEFFWLVIGINLRKFDEICLNSYLYTLFVISLISLPIVAAKFVKSSTETSKIQITDLVSSIQTSKDYLALFKLDLPDGTYSTYLVACAKYCTTVDKKLVFVSKNATSYIRLQGDVFNYKNQRLSIYVFKGRGQISLVPFAAYTWKVQNLEGVEQ